MCASCRTESANICAVSEATVTSRTVNLSEGRLWRDILSAVIYERCVHYCRLIAGAGIKIFIEYCELKCNSAKVFRES